MRLRTGNAPWIALLLLLVPGGCTRRNLYVGGAPLGLDAGGGQPASGTDAGPTDGTAGDRTAAGGAPGGVIRPDAGESACVTAAIPLPWKVTSTPLRLSVVTTTDAIAVMNRLDNRLEILTFARDGTALGGTRHQVDAQLLPYRDGRFLALSRNSGGDFVATVTGPALTVDGRLATVGATPTEHLLGAILVPTNILLVTEERFVSFASGGTRWASILGAADQDALKSSRLFGLAAQGDGLMVAWGTMNALHLATVSGIGALVARADDASFFGNFGSQTATAFAYDTGLLLFDGNPVRVTQIGSDLSRQPLGKNAQLRTFYRTAPQIAPITLMGRLIAFWLTVFPATDNSQGSTTHQLYGCELALADPSSCVSTSPVAATGLDGYGIAGDPVAAAALPDGSGFAIAHSDVYGQTWLRIGDLRCAIPGSAP
jgi:hypothetical protein